MTITLCAICLGLLWLGWGVACAIDEAEDDVSRIGLVRKDRR